MKYSMSRITSSMVTCLLFGFQLSPALATNFTLTDGNSEAIVDSMSQDGMKSWTVDGTNYLNQQWFWFRSDEVPLTSIDNLTLVQENQPNSNELQLQYGTSTTEINVSYEFIGGPNSSGTATLNEMIQITYNGPNNLSLSFFQYSDFDINPLGQDSVTITNGDTITQQGGLASMTEAVTTLTPGTIRVEANLFPNTKNSLNTNPAYQLADLSNSMAGPGNVTSAVQWDVILGQGSSLTITKTKTLSAPPSSPNPIPEPSTFLLFGTGLLMAGLARKTFRR